VADQAPAKEDTEVRTSSRRWARPALLGFVPILTVVVGGALLWAVAAAAEREAVTLTEALPGLVLSIGVSGGSRLTGDFVNVSTPGFAGVAFGLPILAGLLVGRWLRSPRTSSYLLGAVATAGLHAVLALGLGLFRLHDPTSFLVAQTSWAPTSSLVIAALAWGTAWLVAERFLRRTVWLALATVTTTGIVSAIVVAVREGVRADLLPVAALTGGAYGPNLSAFSLLWLPPTEAGVLGGRAADVQSLLTFSAEAGRWTLLVPAVGAVLLVLASSRARGLHVPADAWMRLRDFAIAIAVTVPLTAAAASPRTFGPNGSSRWMGVPDAPASLLGPALVLLLMLVVPQIVAAVVVGDSWPRELAAGVRDRLGGLGASRRQDHRQWPMPTAQPTWGPTTPHAGGGVPPPAAYGAPPTAWPPMAGPPVGGHPHHAAQPHVVAQAHDTSPPVANPFEDDAAPPVSTAWSQVAPAASDPGERVAAPTWPAPASGSPAATTAAPEVDADAWRHAPPPTPPASGDALDGSGAGGAP
jgi:hypothetical protein